MTRRTSSLAAAALQKASWWGRKEENPKAVRRREGRSAEGVGGVVGGWEWADGGGGCGVRGVRRRGSRPRRRSGDGWGEGLSGGGGALGGPPFLGGGAMFGEVVPGERWGLEGAGVWGGCRGGRACRPRRGRRSRS